MAKDKKQFGSQDRNNTKSNSSKNIRKDPPNNQKSKDSYAYNSRNMNYNRTNDKKSFITP